MQVIKQPEHGRTSPTEAIAYTSCQGLHLCYKDYTYHNLCGMIQNKDIAVVKGDKDSSTVIMKKSGYITK